MLAADIASLNVAVTFALAATPVAPLAGVTPVTVGAVVSAPLGSKTHVDPVVLAPVGAVGEGAAAP